MSVEPDKPLPEAMDEAEPQAGWSPVPIVLIVMFALLVYWGMTYLEKHAGGFDARVYPPYASYDELENSQPHEHEDPQIAAGKKVFAVCAACHQSSGMGLAGQYPPLAGSEWVNAKSPNRIIRIVLNGLQGPITVKGGSFNNQMAAWKAAYTDDDIAAVLTYVRQNKDWNNNAPAVTPGEVKAIRDKIQARGTPFSPDELLKLPDNE